ncbi:hypothetical protein Trydic_g19665 [Trypoxylus dichotomus]
MDFLSLLGLLSAVVSMQFSIQHSLSVSFSLVYDDVKSPAANMQADAHSRWDRHLKFVIFVIWLIVLILFLCSIIFLMIDVLTYRVYQIELMTDDEAVDDGEVVDGDELVYDGLSPNDPSSYSRPEQVIVTNIRLVLEARFDTKTFGGTALLSVKKIDEHVNNLVLDAKDLKIESISEKSTQNKLEFNITEPYEQFGSKVTVKLPSDSDEYILVIKYETSPDASGLLWLSPEQTAGKVHPYVYSQFEPIGARSFLPCQDTPSVKTKYQASISVTGGLIAVMSAISTGSEVDNRRSKARVFSFVQNIPVPAYLIAIVVGALESREIGPRSRVWTEKEFIEEAAYELANIEEHLKAAEEICGPYVWERYDLLVLPPSFPYGGMENPCLAYVTPTVLVGDRSLLYIIVHEIVHSWTGNLVTNANFEHFWLNEGFTVFIQRKLAGRRENIQLQDFKAYDGFEQLNETINRLGDNNTFTKLVIELKKNHPQQAITPVPNEKGQLFLRYLEKIVGGPKQFEPFLRKYFDTYKFQSIVTDVFQELYRSHFANVPAIAKIDWNAWLYTPGFPPQIPDFDMTYVRMCLDFTKRFLDWDKNSPIPFTDEDVNSLKMPQLLYFLQEIMSARPQSVTKLWKFERKFGLNSTNNTHVNCRWLRIGLRSHWKKKIKQAVNLVTNVGLMGCVRGIYRAMYYWNETKQIAIDTYNDNKKMESLLQAIIFRDEKVFLTDIRSRKPLYRQPNSRYEERNVQRTRRSDRIGLGIWGWMLGAGLETAMMPSVRTIYGYE